MKRPSKIDKIEFRYSKIIPPKGYLAITFFGVVYINERDREYWEKVKDTQYGKETENHEMIHVKQAAKEKDSWFVYYAKYLGYWIAAMFCSWFDNSIAYYVIPYEMEAYANEGNFNYNLEKFDVYKSYSTKERVQMRKQYKHVWKDYLKTL